MLLCRINWGECSLVLYTGSLTKIGRECFKDDNSHDTKFNGKIRNQRVMCISFLKFLEVFNYS